MLTGDKRCLSHTYHTPAVSDRRQGDAYHIHTHKPAVITQISQDGFYQLRTHNDILKQQYTRQILNMQDKYSGHNKVQQTSRQKNAFV
jgi:hypothetical protein